MASDSPSSRSGVNKRPSSRYLAATSASPRICTEPFCRTASGADPASASKLSALPLTSASATPVASVVQCRAGPLEVTRILVSPRTSTPKLLPASSPHSSRARGERGRPRFRIFSMVELSIASIAIAAMYGDDATGKIVVFAALEPRIAHQFKQLFLAWVLANGFGEIAVACLILRDQPAEQRQHVKRIGIVDRPQSRQCRLREFEHQELAAGL